ncbi:peptide-methionine (S)-S-oxide reductase [Catenovulum sp. 2E275]|uniref:peptide-methionine (S)-S-oxide reductase n=1 Tax=Catenovulum sp. 2E275 TaxID=2980497 RepID=UPI0021CF56C2|nr:peptide-methionine (S)-S-oxide reductase [Catenovulum sp. 2E275]MCU4674565.1 peptide-methionine (S)-S-oxide reductase [Catenovulum sp. 2E275]
MNLANTANDKPAVETIYFAGGCLWGVEEFVKYLPGVESTEAGRANGASQTTNSEYDGYAECVKINFNPNSVDLTQLIEYCFEIIDPYSLNKQGADTGLKYRTGIYSELNQHLTIAKTYIAGRADADKIVVEVLPLTNYVKSDAEHQQRLSRFPNDYCHIPKALLHKYKKG